MQKTIKTREILRKKEKCGNIKDIWGAKMREEKLKEIEDLMYKLEIEGKKGDKTAYEEFYEWDEVVKLYIAPPKKYEKPDLLNGRKW